MACSSCSSVTGCGEWVKDMCDSWRTHGDIQATWGSIKSCIEKNNNLESLAEPGRFNDPDMLQIGNIGLTIAEQRSHFALWCISSAPLLIGTNLLQISDEAL